MLKLLKIFVTVYECNNFTKASELLFISQPTISLRIKQLEDELGTTLFIRQGSKSIEPTAQAHYLYEQATDLLAQWEKIKFTLQHGDLEEVQCRICCSNTFGYYYFPQLLPRLIAQFPKVHFSIDIMNTDEAVRSMYHREATFAFIEQAVETAGLTKKVLFQDELVLAGHADAEYWLMREQKSGSRFFNELYLAETNKTPNMVEVNNEQLLQLMLAQNFGQAIVSKCAIANTSIPFKPLSAKYMRDMFIVTHPADTSPTLRQIELFITVYFQTK